MISKLKRLQNRMTKLEELKSELALSDQFGQYIKLFEIIRVSMEETRSGSYFAAEAYSNEIIKKKVITELKKVIRDAKKISKEINNDAYRVQSRAVENKVTDMKTSTESAATKLKDAWNKEITNNVSKWVGIAEVVNDLGAQGGRDFKLAVDKLKRAAVPNTEEQVTKIKEEKNAVQNGISKLGLEGAFGKFLKLSAEGKASAKDLLNEEVRNKMDKYDLWDSFRVILGQ